MTRKLLGTLIPVVLAGTWIAVGAAAASAAPTSDCKTVVTNVVDRPDNGHGTGGTPQPGYWALDTHKRTVTVCRMPAPTATADVKAKAIVVAAEEYTAKGVDDGTFVTKAGATLSPNNGQPLVGGRKGKLYGTFEWTITAPANWQFFDASKQAGKTVTGDPKTSAVDDNPGTAEWINGWWPGADVKPVFKNNWSWLYWLCGDHPGRNLAGFKGEYWWDAASAISNDGQSKLAGDILGKQVCPTPSSVTPTVTATATVPPVEVSNNLPTTGKPIVGLVVVGVVTILLGGAAIRLARRRNTRFTA